MTKDIGARLGLNITDYREWQIKAVLACPVAKSNVSGDRADWVWKVAGELLEDRNKLVALLEKKRKKDKRRKKEARRGA